MADGPNDWIDPGPPASIAPSSTGPNDWIGGAPATASTDPDLANAIATGVLRGVPGSRAIGSAIGATAGMADKYMGAWGPGAAIEPQPGESWSDLYKRNYAMAGQKTAQGEADYPKTSFAASLAPGLIGGGGARPILSSMAYGAGLGTNEAENWSDVPSKATMGAITGGVGAGIMKGALGAVMPYTGAIRDAAMDAAQRLGITMPRYAASPYPIVQRAGELAKSIPVASAPVQQATKESLTGLGGAASDIAQGSTTVGAGQTMSDALNNWVGPGSQARIKAAYDYVGTMLDPTVTTPLTNTQNIAQAINASRAESYLGSSPAVGHVADALASPNGLTYNGIKNLRSSLGEMLNQSILPAGMQQSELKRLYGGLSDDLQQSVSNAATDPQAPAAFARANAQAKAVNDQRTALTKLLGGSTGGASDESVYSALQRASQAKGGNLELLQQAKNAVPPNDWNELAQGMVSNMGRDADGNFSPALFLRDYGKIGDTPVRTQWSPSGAAPTSAKDELFGQGGQTVRQNLDDIAAVSRQWATLRNFANPSGTGHVVGGLAALEYAPEMVNHPLATIATALGANGVGRFLASPAGSGAASNWMRANMAWATRPNPATVQAIHNAATRIAGTAAARIGVNVDPLALAAAALNERQSGSEHPGLPTQSDTGMGGGGP